jgi:predicted secreted hydrolase
MALQSPFHLNALSYSWCGLHHTLCALIALISLTAPTARADGGPASTETPPLAQRTVDGFAVPQPDPLFTFPRDHGSHPDYKIEWWYLTGHLYESDGGRYGFQATFFRRAAPRATAGTAAENASAFGHAHLHLAHMALLDVRQQRYLHDERLNREGWDARASETTLDLRNGNWTLRLDADGETVHLHGSIRAEAAFSLALRPQKPLVIFGERGVSRKAADPTAASYYLTFTRLHAEGTLTLAGTPRPVSGQAWMDHEISSSQLSDEQAGWDWASLQLRDGREVMVYRMRHQDGSTGPFSTFARVSPEGRVEQIGPARFQWQVERTWRSRATGAEYPIGARITATFPGEEPEQFVLEPLFDAQEMVGRTGALSYWEGACRVLDAQGQEIGPAYMELAGYAGDLSARFR